MSSLLRICLLLAPMVSHAATPMKKATKDGVAEYYNQIAGILTPTNVPFADIYRKPLTLERWGVETKSINYHGHVLFVNAQLNFQVTIDEVPQLIALRNNRLSEFIRTNDINRVSTLSVPQAIEKAKQYLVKIGYPLPDGLAIRKVTFNEERDFCWSVQWIPTMHGYFHDDFVTPYKQQIEVVFHETYGFVAYDCNNDFPPPKSTTVKVSQEAAIEKAEKAVPLIQRSPYYLQCRLPGFKAKSLYSAELLIAAPDWLLDPKRAVWMRDKPPEETRLCWVIKFLSVDTLDRGKDSMLVPPMFVIYIDAATGEIVGANFT